jgi:hypothetical protein
MVTVQFDGSGIYYVNEGFVETYRCVFFFTVSLQAIRV